MQPIIRFDQVSKRYNLGGGVRSLRSSLSNLPKRALGRPVEQGPVHWALKDVSFSLERGASLGLLGQNGAGKTTILKLLSGITQPTSGAISVNGRVASLIELGAGFHPEMTGRENVFMNGAILGMTRQEIKQQFDSIVAFAEIDEYLDTPVKRYSSGMYVRLAFAIAAHISPDILLVDEVLAVGDINFRTKCYRRMADLRKNGTTIIFVSHNVVQVKETCERGLLLRHGNLLDDSPIDDAITAYLRLMQNQAARAGQNGAAPVELDGGVGHEVEIRSVRFLDRAGQPTESVITGEPLGIEIVYRAAKPIDSPVVHVDFYREGDIVSGYSTEYDEFDLGGFSGEGRIVLQIDSLQLAPGNYSTSTVIGNETSQNILAIQHHNHWLEVIRRSRTRGEITLPHSWQHTPVAQRTIA